jgi:aspartate beta-hydroxylase
MSIAYDHARDAVRWVYDHRISTPSILDLPAYFPNARRFTERWDDIRGEALTVARTIQKVPRFHEIMAEQADISAQDGRDWRMFILKAYGVEHRENLAQCPVLESIVSASPEVVSAVISFLAPRKVIPTHRGPFRGILRFHLMLSVPLMPDGRPAAPLVVDGQEFRLGNGDALLWDDTFPHSASNDSDDIRIALLLDVWRKDMPFDMEMLSRMVLRLIQANIRVRGIAYAG